MPKSKQPLTIVRVIVLRIRTMPTMHRNIAFIATFALINVMHMLLLVPPNALEVFDLNPLESFDANTNSNRRLRIPVTDDRSSAFKREGPLLWPIGCSPEAFVGLASLTGKPGYYNKETHFFDRDDEFAKGIGFYASRFENEKNSGEPTLDATPNTFEYADRVRSTYESAGGNQVNEVKLIAMLRDPIERELSMYNHMAYNCREKKNKNPGWWDTAQKSDGFIMSFDEFVTTVTMPKIEASENFGLYAKDLEKWFALFPRKQILVLSYDEFRNDIQKVKERVQTFLGRTIPGEIGTHNEKDDPFKVREVSPKTRFLLEDAFRPHNEKLYQLLNDWPGTSMEESPFPRFER